MGVGRIPGADCGTRGDIGVTIFSRQGRSRQQCPECFVGEDITHSEDVAIPFEAYVIAGEMARGTLSAQTCSWGKPEGYRILDDIKRVITEARFEG